jgi:hypothetical protein
MWATVAPRRVALKSDEPNFLVIASQRVGAKRRPMTGSAKQSILQRKERVDCFAALAMTLIESRISLRSRDAERPRRCYYLRAQRGRGERRVPAAPAASCALVVVESTRVTTSTPESPDVPARNGFTAYFALSSVTGLFCHRRPRTNVLPKPGRADITSANLTPASGRQDHTTSPYAATSLVSTPVIAQESFDSPCNPIARKTLPRPPHPTPRP